METKYIANGDNGIYVSEVLKVLHKASPDSRRLSLIEQHKQQSE